MIEHDMVDRFFWTRATLGETVSQKPYSFSDCAAAEKIPSDERTPGAALLKGTRSVVLSSRGSGMFSDSSCHKSRTAAGSK